MKKLTDSDGEGGGFRGDSNLNTNVKRGLYNQTQVSQSI